MRKRVHHSEMGRRVWPTLAVTGPSFSDNDLVLRCIMAVCSKRRGEGRMREKEVKERRWKREYMMVNPDTSLTEESVHISEVSLFLR